VFADLVAAAFAAAVVVEFLNVAAASAAALAAVACASAAAFACAAAVFAAASAAACASAAAAALSTAAFAAATAAARSAAALLLAAVAAASAFTLAAASAVAFSAAALAAASAAILSAAAFATAASAFWQAELHVGSGSGAGVGFGITLLVAAVIEIVKVVDAVLPLASVTKTVIMEEPAVVGVPEMVPLFTSKVNPVCKVPEVNANEYASAPLVTVKSSENALPVVPVMPDVGVAISGVVVIAWVVPDVPTALFTEFVPVAKYLIKKPSSVAVVV
jgi:hypothetical protein